MLTRVEADPATSICSQEKAPRCKRSAKENDEEKCKRCTEMRDRKKRVQKVEENRRLCGMRRLWSHNPLFLQDSLVAKISSPFSFVSFFPRLRLRSGVFSVSLFSFLQKNKKAAKQKGKNIW